MIFSEKSLSVSMFVCPSRPISSQKKVTETENFTEQNFQMYFKGDKNTFRDTLPLQCSAGQGKANQHYATCIWSHFQVSSWSLIVMPSQFGYVYSILNPHVQNSNSPVRQPLCMAVNPRLCQVKPSYVKSILKPYCQSFRCRGR